MDQLIVGIIPWGRILRIGGFQVFGYHHDERVIGTAAL
jgi:hypothetical protein